MIEIIADWIGKAFGLLRSIPLNSLVGVWSDVVLLVVAVVLSFFIIKAIIKRSTKAIYWIALILGILFWLVIMLGGK